MIWYRRLSFKTRVFLGCLLVALVPLTFSSVVMMRLFTASINRQITVDGNQQLEEVRERFTQLLENCQKACETLTEDGSAAWVMIDNKTIEFQKDLYLSMYQAVQEIYSHAQFSIYDAGGKLRFTTDTAPKSSRLPVNWGLLNKASGEQGITYYRTDPYLPSSGSDVLMQGAFSLESIHGARTGYVVLDFTRENFDNLLNGFYSSGDTLLVLDSHQKPLYCSRPEYGEREISDIIGHTISGQGGTEKEGVYTRYLWTREPSQGFYILLRCSAPISAPAVRTMGTVSLALSGLGLVLCLFISGALSRSIGQPVSLLDKAMAKVKKGDLSIRIRTNRQDELGRLTESFNQMTGDLQKYLDDTVQKQKDLNKTTLKLYQTQLNPHFLYNTLDSIHWLAVKNRDYAVGEQLEALSAIFRHVLNRGEECVTIASEVEFIRNYMAIMESRFGRRVKIQIQTEPGLEQVLIPKLIIQPLVENGILHGLEPKKEGGTILITIEVQGDNLVIAVEDDGVGADEAEITEKMKNRESGKDTFALKNIDDRIKLRYGSAYGLCFESKPGKGTRVLVMMPLEQSC